MWDNYAEMDFPHRSNTRRLAEFPVREAASCEARARRRCADRGMRHAYRRQRARMCLCLGAGRKARQAPCVCASPLELGSSPVPIRAASRWPLCFSAREGAEAGPVRNLKERWGVGTEGCREYFIGVFGKAAKPFFYKRNFEVIIKCINRQLRIR